MHQLGDLLILDWELKILTKAFVFTGDVNLSISMRPIVQALTQRSELLFASFGFQQIFCILGLLKAHIASVKCCSGDNYVLKLRFPVR